MALTETYANRLMAAKDIMTIKYTIKPKVIMYPQLQMVLGLFDSIYISFAKV